jgi:hypothetical protein
METIPKLHLTATKSGTTVTNTNEICVEIRRRINWIWLLIQF